MTLDVAKAHIYSNQMKYSATRGRGPDAFTALSFKKKAPFKISFRSDLEDNKVRLMSWQKQI